ncbi:MAG: CBS domain-containing protein [Candidatus Brocadiae bacterium]|nr:CBS domain-containing protein [Candidatus Brocadiia bacterium]
MYVREWMSAPVLTIQSRVPAAVALEFMEKHNIRRLPVVESGALVGIVTRSDLNTLFGKRKADRHLQKKSVEEVMTPGPWTVSPDDTFESAALLMLRHKISGLPVVSSNKVVGILTESDVFRAFAAILGLAEQGPRVTMHIPEAEDLLEGVRKRVGRMRIRSLVTLFNPRAKRWEVAVRVRGRVGEEAKAETKPEAKGASKAEGKAEDGKA